MAYSITDLDDKYWQSLELELINIFQSKLKYKLDDFTLDALKLTKVKVGDREFPCPIASELWHIFQFVRGKSARVDNYMEILQNVCELVWANPFLPFSSYEINWEEWNKTRLGWLIRLGFLKNHLINGYNKFSATDLSDLAGISKVAIGQKINSGEIKAVKEGKSWVISNKEVKKFLKSRDLNCYI